jgi:hypothetical protein
MVFRISGAALRHQIGETPCALGAGIVNLKEIL